MISRAGICALLVAVGLLLNSCKKENLCDCFKNRGETIYETRITRDFTNLHVYDKIDVYYTQDTNVLAPIITVVTGTHLMKNIHTEVSEGELRIKNGNKCNFVRGGHNEVTVYVTARNVWNFLQDGVGNMYCTNTVKADTVHGYLLNSGDLHLQVKTKYTVGHMHGVGDLYVKGSTDNFFTNTIGQGFVHAQDLVSGYTFIYFGSTGQAHVSATSELDVVIAKTGNVYYYGQPAILKTTSLGSGKLIHS